MVNGVNLNDELNNSQLNGQIGISSVTTNPIKNPYQNTDKNLFIDESYISNEAINLYEKEQEVQKFTNLALSDPEDLSHEQIIEGLFNKGVCNPFSDETISETANSQQLIKDISSL